MITGSLRPAFQWEPSAWSGPEVVRYQVELSTDRTFATSVIKVETTGTSHQPTSNLPASATPPVGARYFWRVRACVGVACSDPSVTWWVNLGRTERDVNGDGFADVVITASGNGDPSTTAGRLYFFRGGAGGTFDNVADTIASNVWYVRASAVGDLNADGFADLIVNVKDNQATFADRLVVLLGGAGTTLDTTPDATFADPEVGSSMAGAGDINGDGFDDLAIYRRRTNSAIDLYFGRSGATFDSTADSAVSDPVPHEFGHFQSAGDVNGDGYADLVIGAPYSNATGEGSGRAYVFFGGAGPFDQQPDAVLSGAAAGDQFGRSVSSAGDVNGDGFSDIVIGASQNDSNGNNAGRAYVYFGGSGTAMSTTADGILSGLLADDHAGTTVSSAGDLNGDGYDEVAVTFIQITVVANTLRGGVHIYLGAPGTELDSTPDTTLNGEADGDNFGERVVAADVNGDGFDDLLVGALQNDFAGFAAGRAYVYLGAAGRSLEASPDGYLAGAGTDDIFGWIASAPAPASPRRVMARRAATPRR